MKKVLFSLLALIMSISISAQITVYEYKEDKAYCTFELDSELPLDSTSVRGTYRAVNHLDIPYFEMTFTAKSYLSEEGVTTLAVTPTFYYYAYLVKLIGQREHMDTKEYKFLFTLEDDIITYKTSEEDKKKILFKSSFSEKKYIDISGFPETFTKVKGVDWGKFSKQMRKNLQDKDKVFGRKY